MTGHVPERPVFRVVIDLPIMSGLPLEDLTPEAVKTQWEWFATELHRAFDAKRSRSNDERIGSLLDSGLVMSVEVVEETFDPRYDT